MSGRALSPEAAAFFTEMRKNAVKEEWQHKNGATPGNVRCVAGIARAVGATTGCMSYYLQGAREPSFFLVLRIANHLGIDLGELQRKFKGKT